VTTQDGTVLSDTQLDALRIALRHGATEASEALHRWIGKPTNIHFDALEQLSLGDATGVLGDGAEPVCFCVVDMQGLLTGQLILAFGDVDGLALTDMLLDQPRGTATAWGEMETSAALETTNILCCAYLNAMSRVFPAGADESSEFIPTPPRFSRDFAESLIQFAVMGQIVASDQVLLAQTRFHIDGAPVDWTLLFVPDAASLAKLREVLD
jgi:chemotaxis protein CheC